MQRSRSRSRGIAEAIAEMIGVVLKGVGVKCVDVTERKISRGAIFMNVGRPKRYSIGLADNGEEV